MCRSRPAVRHVGWPKAKAMSWIGSLLTSAVGLVADVVAPWLPLGAGAGGVLGLAGILAGRSIRRLLIATGVAFLVIAVALLAIGHARMATRSALAERDAARRGLDEAERVNRANLVALDGLRRRHDAEIAALSAMHAQARVAARRLAASREEIGRDPDSDAVVAPVVGRYLERLRAERPGPRPADRNQGRVQPTAGSIDDLRP